MPGSRAKHTRNRRNVIYAAKASLEQRGDIKQTVETITLVKNIKLNIN